MGQRNRYECSIYMVNLAWSVAFDDFFIGEQIYDEYIRSKALSIVYSCTSMLGTMSGVYKVISFVLVIVYCSGCCCIIFPPIINRWRYSVQTETSTMILPMLKPWMAQFSSILGDPVQSENPDDWGIRMEVDLILSKVLMCVLFFSRNLMTVFLFMKVLKCLNKIVQNFSILIGSEFDGKFVAFFRSSWFTCTN